MRGERGQTAAEALGMLLVISVIVAAVSATDAGAKIAGESKRIVCRIGGGECPAEPAGGIAPQGADVQGPPLAGRTLPVLPFPGSVTVTCTYDRRAPETCVPKGQPGVGVTASGEIKVERTPTTLDATGCPYQNLSIQAKLQLTANAEAKGAKAGGSLQGYLGQSTKYQLTVTPSNADEIAAGDRKPPNPVDPRTLANGESILLSEDYYAGIKAKATYRQLQLEMGYDRGRRVSSGVRRLDANTVRVIVGDEDFVRSALKLGVKLGDASVSLGNTKELSDGNLHSVDLDISTEAGWDAYQRFLSSGRLPRAGQTRASTVRYTDTTELEAKFGGLAIGGRGSSSEGRWTETHNPDGSVERVANIRYNNTSIAITEAAGRPPTYSLMLHDVHPSYIPSLYERTGQPQPAGAAQSDVRLDFTEPQLRRLQQIALEKLADRVALNGDGRPTTEEIARSLRENHGVVKYDGVEYAFGGLESALAEATDPDDLLVALYRTGFISQNNVIEELVGLLVGKQRDIPATIVNPSC